jgi:hypothetical protein
MKFCPTCKRNYADDTLVFCTEDGVQLDLVTDPNATFHMPAARDTDPPATLVFPPGQQPAGSGSATWPAQGGMGPGAPSDQTRLAAGQIPPTIPAGGYAAPTPAPPQGAQMHVPLYGQSAGAAVPPKKSSAPWIAAVVILVLVVLGLGGGLGYMWWQSNSKTANANTNTNRPDGSLSNRNTPGQTNTGGGSANTNTGGPNSNANVGGGGSPGDGGGATDGAWLQGTWSGTGTQYDGGTWTFQYVASSGAIEYPSVGCGGRWEPVSIKANEAVFTEKITHGKNCLSDGRVVVTPTSDGALDCKWYYVGDIVGASATLRKQ